MWSRIFKLLSGTRRSASLTAAKVNPRPATQDSLSERVSKGDKLAVDVPAKARLFEAESSKRKELALESQASSEARPAAGGSSKIDGADRRDSSAHWAAARNRQLIYTHKIRTEQIRADGPSASKDDPNDAHAPVQADELPTPQSKSSDGVLHTHAVPPALELPEKPEPVAANSIAEDQEQRPWPATRSTFQEPATEIPAEDSGAAYVATRQGYEEVQTAHPRTNGRFAMLHTVVQQWHNTAARCKYLIVVGSTSESRSLAPLVRTLRAQPGAVGAGVQVCVAGERPDWAREALQILGVTVDMELNVAGRQESLEETRTRMIKGFGKILAEVKPEWVVVQGDSATAAMASIAAYYAQIPVARVDGGTPLQDVHTRDESHPETLHRLIASLFASVHFAETSLSKEGLVREGVPEESIVVTGNTSVDAMHETCALLGLPLGSAPVRSSGVVHVFVVAEMPETLADHLADLCRAIRHLATSVPGLYQFVWPVHADARGLKLVNDLLDRVPGVLLCGPVKYEKFLRNLSECDLVLTDLEDVQEEAPSLGKPVLLMKQATERPEALRAGITTLTGTDARSIEAGIRTLARKLSVRHGSITNPYGDGKATIRMLDFFEGRRVLEFGRTALPRLLPSADAMPSRRLANPPPANKLLSNAGTNGGQ